MNELKIKCFLCGKELKQNGKEGIEIGMLNWYPKLLPWKAIRILCKDCAKPLREKLSFTEEDLKTD